jgi:competence protein ComEA
MQSQASPLSTLVAFIIVALLIIGSGTLLLSSRPEPVQITIHPPIPTATPQPTATPSPILVYITGEVSKPETTVEILYGSRVMDAISAAGGFTNRADKSLVNLAGILHDGDQVHVPAFINTDNDNTTIESLPTPSGGNVIYVNTATLDELETLPGVGPALAQRIIDYRTESGSFTRLEDLDNVSGIGEATLDNLRDLIAFD